MTSHYPEFPSSLAVVQRATRRTAGRAVSAGAALAAALMLASCSAPASAPNGDGASTDSLTIGTVVDVESFDPAVLASGGDWPQIWGAVHDTLLKLEPDGSVSENLATSWEYSDDNTTLTLDLRDDVTFTDGAAFDAEAVKANIEHFQQGTGTARYTADAIDSVDVIDEYTVALNLSVADPVLERSLSLALGAMASPDALNTDDLALMPVGSLSPKSRFSAECCRLLVLP